MKLPLKGLQHRLDQVIDRIDNPSLLKNEGLGNEIGFWIFDYPAKFELMVRDHIEHISEKLQRRGHQFIHINVFQSLVELLESRKLFDRACQREKQVGLEALKKSLSGPLSQDKLASYIQERYPVAEQDFVIVSGLGTAWPLVRGHELLSALQAVMGSTPLILFYPGEYSGSDLHPFGLIESKNYYRAFKLVPDSERSH